MSYDLDFLQRTSSHAKLLHVRVAAVDADLDFQLEEKALGRHLLDLVCRTLGLREVWYFGLQYKDVNGRLLCLRMHEQVTRQNVVAMMNEEGRKTYVLWLVAKFYPEVAESELIQDITRQLFYMQTKQAILTGSIHCPPETAVLLATYSLQAERGDYEDSDGTIVVEDLLPAKVLEQYEMTNEMWQEKIVAWWQANSGYTRSEAHIEYLKIAQDLPMYGVHYFEITNAKRTTCWLGVHAHGLGIYSREDRITPVTSFKWSEIVNLTFKNKKFKVITAEPNATLVFHTSDIAVSQTVLDLCLGAHNLYLRRRQPDSIEIQQMRRQAKAERELRKMERAKLERERGRRLAAERELEMLRQQLETERSRREAAELAIQQTNEMAALLAEKARISEEEALMLAKRAAEAESEMQRVRLAAIQSEEAHMQRLQLERRTRDVAADLAVERSLQFHDELTPFADAIPLTAVTSAQQWTSVTPLEASILFPPLANGGSTLLSGSNDALPDVLQKASTFDSTSSLNNENSNGQYAVHALSAELERERLNYASKSRLLQEQLSELRHEIEGLKTDDAALHESHTIDKQSTLRKAPALRRRVTFH